MPPLPIPSDTMLLTAHAGLLLLMAVGLRALRRWPAAYLVARWPGTVGHELMHLAAGLLTGARPVGFSVLPRRAADGGWVLGEVAFARLRWWNGLPVGLAPLALLPAGGWAFLHSTNLPLLSASGSGWKLLALQCAVAAWPSPRDWAASLTGLLIVGAGIAAGYLMPG